MNINNSLPNNFSNNVYESTPVTYNNNVSVISDQNNDATIPPDHYQHNVSNNVPNHNYQQHIQQSGISNNNATNPTITSDHNHHHNYQQHMSNVDTNNNVTFPSNNSNHAFTHHQSTSNNVFSPPQSYNEQNQPSNPSQSNILPLLNSFGININSPQATIIIIPTTNSDILQRVLARFQ
ncbi:unnamed protein product [Rhizophagus irregularis]|uniref:Uncharacterized protein n=1 Tax=Rhizophagus irregularis TaxID=588596 RepID=A0A2N1N9Z1_9GLOM|nr:hypothetical protein RhiirC2_829601 [Rhizophagus irregularis]CAB4391343.1 unnamed protein product [Rhizophagus irregularis]CAB5378433.1 unnamed protein product [Rhizophagus irregularis]